MPQVLLRRQDSIMFRADVKRTESLTILVSPARWPITGSAATTFSSHASWGKHLNKGRSDSNLYHRRSSAGSSKVRQVLAIASKVCRSVSNSPSTQNSVMSRTSSWMVKQLCIVRIVDLIDDKISLWRDHRTTF